MALSVSKDIQKVHLVISELPVGIVTILGTGPSITGSAERSADFYKKCTDVTKCCNSIGQFNIPIIKLYSIIESRAEQIFTRAEFHKIQLDLAGLCPGCLPNDSFEIITIWPNHLFTIHFTHQFHHGVKYWAKWGTNGQIDSEVAFTSSLVCPSPLGPVGHSITFTGPSRTSGRTPDNRRD